MVMKEALNSKKSGSDSLNQRKSEGSLVQRHDESLSDNKYILKKRKHSSRHFK